MTPASLWLLLTVRKAFYKAAFAIAGLVVLANNLVLASTPEEGAATMRALVQSASARSLWRTDAALPPALFGPSTCTLTTSLDTKNYGSDWYSFFDQTSGGYQAMYAGFCLLRAGLEKEAREAFVEARSKLSAGLESLVAAVNSQEAKRKELEERQARIRSTQQALNALAPLLRPTDPQRAANFDQSMRLNNAMTSLQLNMLSRDIASIKVMPITQLGQTIRLPVVPIGGFSRLLVKVQHDRGHCTGSFVGPRLVLTNLHCIGPNMRVNRDLIFYQERYPVVRWHTVAGTDFTPGPRDVEDRFWDEDWAILEVGGPLRDDASQFLSVQPGLKIGDSVMLAGYSGDVSAGRYLTLDIGCPVMAMNTRVIFQCSSAGGSSGSPVLSPTDHRVIVALNHSGVRASASTLATSRNRAGAVRVERFLPTLQRLLGPTPPLPGSNPSWDSLLVQYKEERSKPMPTLRDLPSIE